MAHDSHGNSHGDGHQTPPQSTGQTPNSQKLAIGILIAAVIFLVLYLLLTRGSDDDSSDTSSSASTSTSTSTTRTSAWADDEEDETTTEETSDNNDWDDRPTVTHHRTSPDSAPDGDTGHENLNDSSSNATRWDRQARQNCDNYDWWMHNMPTDHPAEAYEDRCPGRSWNDLYSNNGARGSQYQGYPPTDPDTGLVDPYWDDPHDGYNSSADERHSNDWYSGPGGYVTPLPTHELVPHSYGN